MKRYALISLAGLALIGLSACSTPEQTTGTTAGAIGGALVGGPVGAVVGGTVGAVATEPGMPLGAHRPHRLPLSRPERQQALALLLAYGSHRPFLRRTRPRRRGASFCLTPYVRWPSCIEPKA